VRALDLDGRRVEVEPADVDFYTSPLSEKETEILEPLAGLSAPALRAGYGRLRVEERVVGFERRRTLGQEVLDRGEVDLPPVVSEPHGLWFHAPPGAAARFEARGTGLLGALHALEHAAIGLLPSRVLCDRNDLGGISLSFHPQLGGPGVFVYEGHSGGVGIAKRALAELPALLDRVADLLERCPCESGCPSCVQSPKCGNGNRPLDKAGALELARELAAGAADAVVTPAASAPRPTLAPAQPAPSGTPGKLERTTKALRFETKTEAETGVETEAETKTKDFLLKGKTETKTKSKAGAVGAAGSAGAMCPTTGEAVGASEGRDRSAGGTSAAPTAPSTESLSSSPSSRSSSSTEEPSSLPSSSPSAGESRLVSPGRERPGRTGGRGAGGGPTVLFDVETRRSADEVGGWSKAHRMGIAVAVALHLEEGRFETFLEPDVPRLVAALKGAGLVIGYNSRRFDYAVLSGYTGEDYARTLPTLDLLETLHGRLRFRVGLGHVARETLGVDKSADGLASLEWVRQGRLDLVEEYCRRDVEILRDVYLFGRREGHVVVSTKAGRIRVEVDW
jgi:DEAD/DEAH box helicase domain-containing protein